MEEPSSFYMSHCQVTVEISQKLGKCHVRRRVSRDRRILVMELEMGKPTHAAYLLLKYICVLQMPFLVWVLILS